MHTRSSARRRLAAIAATPLLAGFALTPPSPAASATTPHILVVMLENQGYHKTLGSCGSDPYFCSLASTYASVIGWTGVTHPSLPNYLALTSGSTQGCTTDTCGRGLYSGDLMAQLNTAGIPWTMYMESMPKACLLKDAKPYRVHHNPGAYFTDDTCATDDVPYPGASALVLTLDGPAAPDLVWITPNIQDDMAQGTIPSGDSWLQSNLSGVLSSSWFTGGNATVIVTMDEHQKDRTGGGGVIPMVVISSNALGKGNVAIAGNHYATLGVIEQAFGLALLNNATAPATLSALIG